MKTSGRRIYAWGDTSAEKKLPAKRLPQPTYRPSALALAEQPTSITLAEQKTYWMELSAWVNKHQPKTWIVLSVGSRMDYIEIHAALTRFIHGILQEAYGKKWSAMPLATRPFAIGFFEHPRTNLHINLLLRAPFNFILSMEKHGGRIWRKLGTKGHVWIDDKDPTERLHGYCKKEQWRTGGIGSFYIYSPMRKKR